MEEDGYGQPTRKVVEDKIKTQLRSMLRDWCSSMKKIIEVG